MSLFLTRLPIWKRTVDQRLVRIDYRSLINKGGPQQAPSTYPHVVSANGTPPQQELAIPVESADSRTPKRLINFDKPLKPFSSFLVDKFGREHNYLRISITEKCNLRCLYCMPAEGVTLSPTRELLTTAEIVILASLFVSQGVTKIRLTGGEPTVRRDILFLMEQLGSLRQHGLKEICLTTNGITLHRHLDKMIAWGLTNINISLDTLDPHLFQIMTRRNGFSAVMKNIDQVLERNALGAGIKFKINCVVMRNTNNREILDFVEFVRNRAVEVRFLEYLPFDGNKWAEGKMMPFAEMLDLVKEHYPTIEKVPDHVNDTGKSFRIPGFIGQIAFVTSITDHFCGSCNRLRLMNDGNLKVCLFGNAEVSLRDLLRKYNNGEPLGQEDLDYWKTEALSGSLGSGMMKMELLDMIKAAVGKKAAKHAGLGVLENMKNRPMILIGG
ncbi:probable molybdenum cofactor biosynthesis protein 1 B [Phialocephala subalpina]|uniref:GTP 3',8-cyclase n=1 Tax=Phialocephala subalpina TaxID=576137 RepID=A0A1L7XYN5_9HELO|nr:probable molybdenum cofactor biosynthesis protein 1 B [Phialocephala subalpina]